jgi:hypothetical protein
MRPDSYPERNGDCFVVIELDMPSSSPQVAISFAGKGCKLAAIVSQL